MLKINLQRIGFGGGCHWCTEACFQSLRGVVKVEQGWISSKPPNESFSEAVIVHYNRDLISLNVLIDIHLRSHSSTNKHSMRGKYRSAIYFFDYNAAQCEAIVARLLPAFDNKIITVVLPFIKFMVNAESYKDYYKKNRDGPFCERFIAPNLQMIEQAFSTNYQKI